jgi:hypothetical protein
VKPAAGPLDWEEVQAARAAREPARRAYAPWVGLFAASICLRSTTVLLFCGWWNEHELLELGCPWSPWLVPYFVVTLSLGAVVVAGAWRWLRDALAPRVGAP